MLSIISHLPGKFYTDESIRRVSVRNDYRTEAIPPGSFASALPSVSRVPEVSSERPSSIWKLRPKDVVELPCPVLIFDPSMRAQPRFERVLRLPIQNQFRLEDTRHGPKVP
jgi:hypothetical protein